MVKHEQGPRQVSVSRRIAAIAGLVVLSATSAVALHSQAEGKRNTRTALAAETGTPATTPTKTVTGKPTAIKTKPIKTPTATKSTTTKPANVMPDYGSLKNVDWTPIKMPAASKKRSGVIILDPSRSGKAFSVTDPKTGLKETDKPVPVEQTETMNMALLLEKNLEKKGYTVLLTKTASDTLTSRERVDFAEKNKADLAVSIYTAHDTDSEGQYVYVPATGHERGNVKYTNSTLACSTTLTGLDFAHGLGAELETSTYVTAERNYKAITGAVGNISLRQLFASGAEPTATKPTQPVPDAKPDVSKISPTAKATVTQTARPTASPTSKPTQQPINPQPTVEYLPWVEVVSGAKFSDDMSDPLPLASQKAWASAAAEGIDEAMVGLTARQTSCK